MSELREGFRLHRFEMLNWGTFDQKVWKIEPRNHNALLTGDIGSGKSTLVDAITILLVPRPSNLIVFNKAAGAEAQERSLRSYVLGEYKNEVDAESQKARAVALRKPGSYSVLLATFINEASQQPVCLAQVFFFREKGGQPERLFIVSEQDLSIAKDFQGFKDIQELRLRLRKAGVKVGDGLKDYAAQFRRLMGIPSDRALELFYQTLSMKSVSDLTHFVREHMLETDDSKERVEKLCQGFEDLDKAHKAVVKARHQIELLQPIVAAGLEHQNREQESAGLKQQRDLLEFWRAQQELRLEREKEARLEDDIRKISLRIDKAEQDKDDLATRERGLQQAILDNGGARLHELERDLKRWQIELSKVQENRNIYAQRIHDLEFSIPDSLDQFAAQQTQLKERQGDLSQDEQAIEHSRDTIKSQWSSLQSDIRLQQDEIDSLQGRPSNIPKHLMDLRRSLCSTLNLDESRLPFAGELIQVLPEEQAWEGAIERVLHNFALSLLVSDNDYQQVSEWVDKTHLKGRLVYYKLGRNRRSVDWSLIDDSSLVRKLVLKEDSHAYGWLLAQLADRFDTRCCESLEEFRRASHAITRQGQIKSGGERHEKDDRHSIMDRSRYVLGWNNQAKLQALRQKLKQCHEQAQTVALQLSELEQRRSFVREQKMKLTLLLETRNYSGIDQDSILRTMDTLQREQSLIENGSSRLRDLQSEVIQVQKQIKELADHHKDLLRKQAGFNSDLETCRRNQDYSLEILRDGNALILADSMPYIESRYADLFDDPLNLQNLKLRERTMREKIQAELDALSKRINNLRDQTIKGMQNYCQIYPVESAELGVSLDALADFRLALDALVADGLPDFEARFKQELNEKTIQSVAHFQNRLERSMRDIKDRLRQINISLHEIDYNEGTYIELQPRESLDLDIRQFRVDLRACLEGSLSGELYNEQSFLRVKTLIERFKGRAECLEADRRWTNRVTDVRYWFEFAAHEIYRENGQSKEYYESGSAKSGGQKEKLAYTVLASALAYQYGVNEKSSGGRSFRFVCIDEAFGKGSDESTRYGLELFRKLGLQLLVVTPLQKIRVIEDYVRAVHFVHNEGGKCSKLRNLTIDEYRDLRDSEAAFIRSDGSLEVT